MENNFRDSVSDIDETILAAEYQSKYENEVLKSEKKELIDKNLSLELKQTKAFMFVLIVFCILALIYARYRQKVMDKLSLVMKQMQQEKNNAVEAKLQAEHADSLKSLFLQNMSHEIRTPLNAIVGFNDVLNNSDQEFEKDERKLYVKIINDNSDLLLTLVNDILDISKFESKTYTPIISLHSVEDICNNVIRSVANKVNKDVSLRIVPQNSSLLLNTDSARLSQVLINFLTNAAKYTERGFIELSYKLKDDKVIFKVKDSGVGIPKEDINRIFNRFEKLDDFKQGTGLGLNICLLIADMLHGKVYVDSVYEGGACFVFEHPLKLE